MFVQNVEMKVRIKTHITEQKKSHKAGDFFYTRFTLTKRYTHQVSNIINSI